MPDQPQSSGNTLQNPPIAVNVSVARPQFSPPAVQSGRELAQAQPELVGGCACGCGASNGSGGGV